MDRALQLRNLFQIVFPGFIGNVHHAIIVHSIVIIKAPNPILAKM